jgi:hypothetical protein
MVIRGSRHGRRSRQNGLIDAELILGETFMTGAVIYIAFLGAMVATAIAAFFGLRAAKII